MSQNTGPFIQRPAWTAVAINYKNARMIADDLFPRADVDSDIFKWTKFDLGETFRIPDTTVPRKGAPNQVEFGETELTDQTVDRGLDMVIPKGDLLKKGANRDKYMMQLTASQMGLVVLDREARVAALAQDSAQYASGNTVTLSGTSQFSDFTNSDPLGVFQDAMDAMIQTPNIGWMGRPVWSKLVRHPQLVAAYHGNEGAKGMITVEWLRQLLGLDKLLIGDAWKTTSKKGQTDTKARVWGKYLGFAYVDPAAMAGMAPTFGFTAQFGTRVAGEIDAPLIGLDGSTIHRVGERVKETVCASDLGYLVINAVA